MFFFWSGARPAAGGHPQGWPALSLQGRAVGLGPCQHRADRPTGVDSFGNVVFLFLYNVENMMSFDAGFQPRRLHQSIWRLPRLHMPAGAPFFFSRVIFVVRCCLQGNMGPEDWDILRAHYEGREVRVRISDIRNKGYLELGPTCPIGGNPVVQEIHRRAGSCLKDRDLHISA